MASVLRQRFGAFRIRTGLPTISQQHPVHSPSLIAKRFMGGHGGDDVGNEIITFSSNLFLKCQWIGDC